jgi:FkbM family methyltransferase
MISLLREIPQFKGKRRIVRLLYGNLIRTASNISVKGKFGLVYLLPNLIENIGLDIFINGIYEKETINFILRKLPPNAVFIDVGANIGTIVIPLCRLHKNIEAIGIEASSRVFDYLKKNVEHNKAGNLKFFNKAVSDSDDMEFNFYSPDGVYGKGSFLPVYSDTAEKVTTITLDTLVKNENISKVDFIKVDVEGFEYFVFKGAASLLTKTESPDILFEYLDWAEAKATNEPGCAQRLLKTYGYSLFLLKENGNLMLLEDVILKESAMIFATKKIN